jgi:Ser/Thr protein kinase RdoA (MazF antagonist)
LLGGLAVEDRSQEALKRYRLKIHNIYRARGAFLLETDGGLKLYKCFEGSRNRALFEHKVKEHLFQHGYYNTDQFVKTVDEDIIAEDSAGCQYIMKNWFWGEECNLKELCQIEAASANLARLHNILMDVDFTKEQLEHNISADLTDTFDKRNRELKRVKGYIRDKKQKNEFELSYLNYYDAFYEQGLLASDRLCCSEYTALLKDAVKQRRVCHGNYTYHNIIMLKNKTEAITKTYIPPGWINKQPITVTELTGGSSPLIATTNFEKSYIGLQIADLYQFVRKVMEKNDWDILYGSNMIEAYDRVKPISKAELNILYLLLLYPEKFWKITNFYYNGKKSWVSGRNIQKLNSIGEQNTKKEMFLHKLESIL